MTHSWMRNAAFVACFACLTACNSTMNPIGALRAAGVTVAGGSASYTLAAPAHVSLNIYDANGAIVRELKRREWQVAGDHVVYWDGNDNGGAPLPAGAA